MSLECVSCGLRLTNADDDPDVIQAHWTVGGSDEYATRLPYCGDSPECQRDAYAQLGVQI